MVKEQKKILRFLRKIFFETAVTVHILSLRGLRTLLEIRGQKIVEFIHFSKDQGSIKVIESVLESSRGVLGDAEQRNSIPAGVAKQRL